MKKQIDIKTNNKQKEFIKLSINQEYWKLIKKTWLIMGLIMIISLLFILLGDL